MSDTVQEAAPTEAPVEAPVVEQLVDAAPEQVTEAPENPREEQAAPKPKRADRHVAQLTARNAAITAELEEVRRRAEAAEALLNANKEPASAPKVGETDVEARARQLVEQREFDTKLNSLIEMGRKEFGHADFDSKSAVLASLGANSNPAFMQALVNMPNAEKMVAHLSEDPDALVSLLSKSPYALAAEMGRMAAEINRPAPAPKTVSSAPKPASPITTPAVVPEPDAYDENLTMRQYVELRRKTAPRHLGGMGRPA